MSHKRDSVEEKDYEISKYICQQGYQGYAADTMESKGFDDDLDAELIICNAAQHLESVRRVTQENRIQSKQDELKMRRTNEMMDQQKNQEKRKKDRSRRMGSLLVMMTKKMTTNQKSIWRKNQRKSKKAKKQSKRKI